MHGQLVAAPEARRGQPEREVAHLPAIPPPAIGLPDAAVLFAHRRPLRRLAHCAAAACGSVAVGSLLAPGSCAPFGPWPGTEIGRDHRGIALDFAGVPSAILRPRSSTTTWSEMSMTTPMSCSIRTIGVPHSWFTSRM